MDGFERRKEQKKESIRRAALELFQNYGFKKVSVNDIAERAGVSQIELAGLCTASGTDEFFSHRAEAGKTGRFGAVVALAESG